MFPHKFELLTSFAMRVASVAVALLAVAAPARAGDVPPIVFVSRGPVIDSDGAPAAGVIPGIGPRGRTARVGGRLLLREAGGSVRTLVDEELLFDVADPCVSWDATRVLFSGLAHPDSSWRLYEIAPDGSGFRQRTFSDRNVALSPLGAAARRFQRYDDIDPCYLPDGRVVFASTRYPAISEYDDHLATNIFVMEADGTCMNRLTSERSGAEEPSIDPKTGRIVYARWWVNRDRPSNMTRDGITTQDAQALTDDIANVWQTVSIDPDGSALKLHAGDPRSRASTVCYKPTLLADGHVLGMTAQNGAFSASPGATGIRLFAAGVDTGRAVIGYQPGGLIKLPWAADLQSPESFAAGSVFFPADLIVIVSPERGIPRAIDPAPLADGRLVLSFAADDESAFDLCLLSADFATIEMLVAPGESHELDAAIVSPRPRPPVLVDDFVTESAPLPPTEDPSTFWLNDTFRFDCLNVFMNAPVDAPIPDAPRIAHDARIRFFLNFQRKNSLGRDPAILYREAPLTPQGAVHEHDIPAEVPMFEQLIDAEGKVIMTPAGKAAHVTGMNFARQGEGTKCVGCHAGHSVITVPKNGSDAEWFNVATSATVTASSEWRGGETSPSGSAGQTNASTSPTGSAETAGASTAARVVDRRARSDSIGVAWIAAGDRDESVLLEWDLPIEVSSLVLYGVYPNPAAGTDLRLENCRIELLSDGIVTASVSKTGRIAPEGTTITVPKTVIDAARVTVTKSKGRVLHQQVTGLAEIEVIARIADRQVATQNP